MVAFVSVTPPRSRWAFLALPMLWAACSRSPDAIAPAETPDGLLDRLLTAAIQAGPTLALHVADGALTTAAPERIPALSERALDWGLAAGDDPALMSLTETLAKRGQIETLQLLLTRAPAERQEPIRTAFLETRAREGSIRMVRGGLKRLSTSENADRVRLALALALVERGQLDEAAQLTGGFLDSRLRDEALAAVAVGRAGRGQLTAAYSALATIRSSTYRDGAVAEIALLEYRKGRRRAGTDRAHRIESRWIRAKALASLGRESARSGRKGESRRLLREARTEAETIDDPLLRGTALAHVAERLEAMGRPQQAEDVLTGVPEEAAATVRAARIRRYVAQGKLSAARREAEGLSASGLIAGDAEAELARLEAERGDLDEALARVARILIPALRWRTAGVVAGLAPNAPMTAFREERLTAILQDL